MQVILEAVDGPAVGTRVMVRQGQAIRVGRTQWADFSLPADDDMADVHFELEFGSQGCRLRAQGSAVTAVNEKPASEVWLQSGDQVTAGQTTFAVHLPPGAPVPDQGTGAAGDSAAAEAEAAPPKAPETAADFCEPIELSDDAKPLLTDEQAPGEFLKKLAEDELFPDALAFLGSWLPKPDGVRWGCDCIGELLSKTFGDKESAAFDAAQAWAEEPSEENRRAAEKAAEASEFEGPASWLALAAFWSGGSLAPPDVAEVPPAEGLTARALTGALMMAATRGDPLAAKDRYAKFIEKGQAAAAAIETD